MHCSPDFKTKKALREALKRGDVVRAYQPGGIFPGTTDGVDVIEGPSDYHRWYARVRIEGGRIIKVLA